MKKIIFGFVLSIFTIGQAHSRYFSEDAYKAAEDQKELIIIPNASHVDLYDRTDVIPFDKLTSFFKQYLKENKVA